MKTIVRITLIALLTGLILCGLTYAAVPHLINYQGRLTDSSGTPLNGTYNLTCRIYDAEAAGNLLWEETHSGALIQKGIFSVLLGSVTNLNLAFDKPYFLEIKVGNEVMSPRQRITSAGYAIRAEKAEDANTVANVGVSTTPASNKLLPLDNNAKLPVTALKVYDSGWFAVTTSTTYTKTHNLGTTKCLINVLVSNTADGSGLVVQGINHMCYEPYNSQYHTGVMSLSTTQIQLRTGTNFVYSAVNSSGTVVIATSGYARIIMLALE